MSQAPRPYMTPSSTLASNRGRDHSASAPPGRLTTGPRAAWMPDVSEPQSSDGGFMANSSAVPGALPSIDVAGLLGSCRLVDLSVLTAAELPGSWPTVTPYHAMDINWYTDW